jgi:hypothetical protein
MAADPIGSIEAAIVVLGEHADRRMRPVAEWLAAYLVDGAAAGELGEHLGLSGGGPTRHGLILARRNTLLGQVARIWFGGLPVTTQAKKLSKALAVYETRIWPGSRMASECPHQPGSMDAAMWQILRLRGSALSSRQVYRALRRK